MKYSAILAITVVCLLSQKTPGRDQRGEPYLKSGLEGTWRMVSYKFGEMPELVDAPKDTVCLRFVTPTGFVWTTYDAKSKQIVRSSGGKYSVQGNTYQETIEFAATEEERAFLGKKLPFTFKVRGNRLNRLGTLPGGLKVEDVWERQQP